MNVEEVININNSQIECFKVNIFEMHEEINKFYTIKIEGIGKELKKKPGDSFNITFFNKNITSIITHIKKFPLEGEGCFFYFLELKHKLYQLTKYKKVQVFKEDNPKQVMENILKNYNIKNKIHGEDRKKYIIQMNETDFDFLQRIIGEFNLCLRCEFDASINIKKFENFNQKIKIEEKSIVQKINKLNEKSDYELDYQEKNPEQAKKSQAITIEGSIVTPWNRDHGEQISFTYFCQNEIFLEIGQIITYQGEDYIITKLNHKFNNTHQSENQSEVIGSKYFSPPIIDSPIQPQRAIVVRQDKKDTAIVFLVKDKTKTELEARLIHHFASKDQIHTHWYQKDEELLINFLDDHSPIIIGSICNVNNTTECKKEDFSLIFSEDCQLISNHLDKNLFIKYGKCQIEVGEEIKLTVGNNQLILGENNLNINSENIDIKSENYNLQSKKYDLESSNMNTKNSQATLEIDNLKLNSMSFQLNAQQTSINTKILKYDSELMDLNSKLIKISCQNFLISSLMWFLNVTAACTISSKVAVLISGAAGVALKGIIGFGV